MALSFLPAAIAASAMVGRSSCDSLQPRAINPSASSARSRPGNSSSIMPMGAPPFATLKSESCAVSPARAKRSTLARVITSDLAPSKESWMPVSRAASAFSGSLSTASLTTRISQKPVACPSMTYSFTCCTPATRLAMSFLVAAAARPMCSWTTASSPLSTTAKRSPTAIAILASSLLLASASSRAWCVASPVSPIGASAGLACCEAAFAGSFLDAPWVLGVPLFIFLLGMIKRALNLLSRAVTLARYAAFTRGDELARGVQRALSLPEAPLQKRWPYPRGAVFGWRWRGEATPPCTPTASPAHERTPTPPRSPPMAPPCARKRPRDASEASLLLEE